MTCNNFEEHPNLHEHSKSNQNAGQKVITSQKVGMSDKGSWQEVLYIISAGNKVT